jgi:hypothetical protein
MATINDRRENVDFSNPPYGFCVFTDSFMSGWGGAEGGRSLYAVAVANDDEACTVLNNGKDRSEMKRGRFVLTLANVRLGARDHLSITDRESARPWFDCGAFRK